MSTPSPLTVARNRSRRLVAEMTTPTFTTSTKAPKREPLAPKPLPPLVCGFALARGEYCTLPHGHAGGPSEYPDKVSCKDTREVKA